MITVLPMLRSLFRMARPSKPETGHCRAARERDWYFSTTCHLPQKVYIGYSGRQLSCDTLQVPALQNLWLHRSREDQC